MSGLRAVWKCCAPVDRIRVASEASAKFPRAGNASRTRTFHTATKLRDATVNSARRYWHSARLQEASLSLQHSRASDASPDYIGVARARKGKNTG
ncbi:MAG: hypothetical protein Q4G03_12250 [Planctomycetia bacterium]|nr:hypothetical protein [Planctomycetia bacterium]